MRRSRPVFAKLFFISMAFVCLAAVDAEATEEFAALTGQQCCACHLGEDGGSLSSFGLGFREGGYQWPIPPRVFRTAGETASVGRIGGKIHVFMFFLHILAAAAWAGAIIYIHLVLTPAVASRGIPRRELTYAWCWMGTITVTGVLLLRISGYSFAQFRALEVSPFLILKLSAFALLVLMAALVTVVVSPRLKRMRPAEPAETVKKGSEQGDLRARVFTPESLAACDGKGGNPAYVGYGGKVFDVSSSPMWRDGLHMRQHPAGNDLSGCMESAPHEADVLERFQEVGDLSGRGAGRHGPSRPRPVLLFYTMAYTNLAMLIMVFLFTALWKRG